MKLDTTFLRNYMRIYVEDVVVFCHGLPYESGSVTQKGYDDIAKDFAYSGLNSVIFDFSGTGLSKGDFKIENWVEDLLSIVHEFKSVSLVGFSMGGVVATYVSANSDNIKNLVLVGVPCCAETVTDEMLVEIFEHNKLKGVLRGLKDFESFKARIKRDLDLYQPVNWIGEVRCPKLIVHGTSDQIIPYEDGERLYAEAKEPKYFLRVVNGSHFLRRHREVMGKIKEWIVKKEKYGRVIQEIVV
ncbi:Lysophospholipase [Archaeoglobus sulfaticallidus PM70-1]|uniref:Lysophospholipase n=1 Tax=Archaeoglobus sulfaticallidus PM70-1 TaxID=387631 RepID=N0BCJ6_9EURY|nr:alpha/beta fold hydrolase [Archaeoglobus sulfaticallidus]AGK60728.1 Lysophospholipase [Archaeoglobus sulfaticallidus PM70-1]